MDLNSTARFSNRVDDYSRYRPGYPDNAIEYIASVAKMDSRSCIADIGSGTGILTEPLLKLGGSVVAVEPNELMRAESDKRLAREVNYSSLAGTAEDTTLPDNSVDLITAAQAFHWFDAERAKAEFTRILKPNGNIALIWNRRDSMGSGFLSQYESLLDSHLPEYSKVSHSRATDEVISKFLGSDVVKKEYPNHQDFDFEGLQGRLQSSSYCPKPDNPLHRPLMEALEELFNRFSVNGKIRFNYSTQIYTV